ARNRHADGVGADARLPALPRWDHWRGVAHHDADQSCARIFLSPERRRAEMVGLAGHHHRKALPSGNADAMLAADFGNALSDTVLPVLHHPRAHLSYHAS